MSKTYKITYTETLIHDFYVDAENETEAEEKLEQGLADGEFDFSHGYLGSTDYKIEECQEFCHFGYVLSNN